MTTPAETLRAAAQRLRGWKTTSYDVPLAALLEQYRDWYEDPGNAGIPVRLAAGSERHRLVLAVARAVLGEVSGD